MKQMEKTVPRFKIFLKSNNLSNEILRIRVNVLDIYLGYFYFTCKNVIGQLYAPAYLICICAFLDMKTPWVSNDAIGWNGIISMLKWPLQSIKVAIKVMFIFKQFQEKAEVATVTTDQEEFTHKECKFDIHFNGTSYFTYRLRSQIMFVRCKLTMST